MKIGIFTNNYLPNPYGVSGSIESFRKEFEKKDHQVFIFAPNWKGYEDKNPNVFRFPSFDLKYKINFPLSFFSSRKMDKIISPLYLDIIHSQHPNLLGKLGMTWARRKNIPLVFTWHTLYDKYLNYIPFIPSKLFGRFIINQAVKYANQSDAVVAPTDSIIGQLWEWGVKKDIFPIATGVAEEDFSNPNREKIRERHNIKDDEILLILISRLAEEKNIRFIFDSITGILKSQPKVRFLLGGEGYLLPKFKEFVLKNKIESKVIFPGMISKEELKDYLSAGDIFVHASRSETQGMILTEAMYSGLPVVAVSATGANSLISDGINGFLIAEKEKDFSEAVEKLIKNSELRKKMSEESKRIAKEKFIARICAEKMLELYKNLIDEKRQTSKIND